MVMESERRHPGRRRAHRPGRAIMAEPGTVWRDRLAALPLALAEGLRRRGRRLAEDYLRAEAGLTGRSWRSGSAVMRSWASWAGAAWASSTRPASRDWGGWWP